MLNFRRGHKYPGVLVSFEGGEGAGKSTQLRRFHEHLMQRYGESQVLLTREPGGTEIGEQVRNLLVHGKEESMCDRTELMLFNTSRAQIVEELVIPALSRGAIVLSDRLYDSTIIYQGLARGLDMDFIRNHLIPFVMQGITPDITYLLDIEPEQGLQNIRQRPGRLTNFDKKDIKFHRTVNEGFRNLAREEADRFKVIPYQHGNPGVMQAQIRMHFDRFIDYTGYKGI